MTVKRHYRPGAWRQGYDLVPGWCSRSRIPAGRLDLARRRRAPTRCWRNGGPKAVIWLCSL